jgi:hypothetical protein
VGYLYKYRPFESEVSNLHMMVTEGIAVLLVVMVGSVVVRKVGHGDGTSREEKVKASEWSGWVVVVCLVLINV